MLMTQECELRRHSLFALAAMLTPFLVLAAMAYAQEYEMSRWTIDGGGVMNSTGGNF